MHARRGEKFLPKAGRGECGKVVGGVLGGRSGGEEEGTKLHVAFLHTTHKHTYTYVRGKRREREGEKDRGEEESAHQ